MSADKTEPLAHLTMERGVLHVNAGVTQPVCVDVGVDQVVTIEKMFGPLIFAAICVRADSLTCQYVVERQRIDSGKWEEVARADAAPARSQVKKHLTVCRCTQHDTIAIEIGDIDGGVFVTPQCCGGPWQELKEWFPAPSEWHRLEQESGLARFCVERRDTTGDAPGHAAAKIREASETTHEVKPLGPPTHTDARAAIRTFFDRLDRQCFRDETWQWAMNEMSDSVNTSFSGAMDDLHKVIE